MIFQLIKGGSYALDVRNAMELPPGAECQPIGTPHTGHDIPQEQNEASMGGSGITNL